MRNLSTFAARALAPAAFLALCATPSTFAQCPADDDAGTNDTCATAQALAAFPAGPFSASLATGGDFYAITVPANSSYTITALFSHAQADIDTALFDDAGTCLNQIDGGASVSDNEVVTGVNCSSSPATVILNVFVWSGSAGNCGDYTVDVTSAPICALTDDANEDNDDFSTATPVTLPINQTGLLATLCDEDWFAFTVGPLMDLTVTMPTVFANGDVDVFLWDATGTTILEGASTTLDTETFTWTNFNAVAENVLLQVNIWPGSLQACNNYDLMASEVPTTNPCAVADDGFEDNDDCLTASAVTAGTQMGLFVRKDGVDNDWFSICVPDGGTLTVDALFLQVNSDIDMVLYDSCGGVGIDFATSVTDNEQVSITNATGGDVTYFWEIYVWGGDTNDCGNYDMVVTTTGGTCGPPNLTSSCFGDGGDQLGCTNCPCSNNAPMGSGGGCLNSSGGSARLVASGTPDVTTPADTLHFNVTDANVSTFGILTSGNNQLPNNPANVCFAQNPGSGVLSPGILDGLRCIGAGVLRHGSRASDVNGDIGITNNGWGPPNNPMAGLGVTSGFTAGQTRHFQCFYRENAAAVCMTGQNTTQAVSVTFL